MSANEHDDDQPDMMDVIERLRVENVRLREAISVCEAIARKVALRWRYSDGERAAKDIADEIAALK